MTLPSKCLLQQHLFITDSYPFQNWLGMFTSLHPPGHILTQTCQSGPKKVTWLCQVLHVQSFCWYFSYFPLSIQFWWFHQPAAQQLIVPCQCAEHVGGIAMPPPHDEGPRTLWPPKASKCLRWLSLPPHVSNITCF